MASIPRLSGLGAALLSLCLLIGCQNLNRSEPESDLNGTINILISLDGDEDFSSGKLEEQAALTKRIAQDYQYLRPGVNVEIELTRERELIKRVKSRHAEGLSPDLILVSGRTARALHREQLSLPIPITRIQPNDVDPGLIQRLRVSNNQIAGIPVFLIPQIACFNRKKISQNPRDLESLTEISDRGNEVGMALDMVDLFWTVRPWGGQQALDASPSIKPLTRVEKQAILQWLESLLNASKHLEFNFYNHQDELVLGLINGRLDWITCRSSSLARLRDKLGDRLGVGALPSGPAGAASPIITSKVWVFGKDSSTNQRKISNSFVSFSINPIMQRYTTLTSEQMLPANQSAQIPTSNSAALTAMVSSKKQSLAGGIFRNLNSNDEQLTSITQLVTDMIFGERSPKQVRDAILNLMQ